MMEIDHTAVNNPDSPPSEPVKPILASQLLELEKKQRKRFTGQGRDERISTGCGEIDEILGRGCERGIVVGISAEGGEGRLVSLHLLSSILISYLASPTQSPLAPKATIIDTTGSFPVSILAQVLKSRIISSRTASATAAVRSANYPVSGHGQLESETEIEKEVQRGLEMVAISRVFDIEGLWEVLGEVGRPGTSKDEDILENGSEADPRMNQQSPQKPPEIIDSEEELTPESTSPPRDQNEDSGVELIVIDNMTHIISELLARKEKSEAHTLLALLSQTLHTLTHTSNILTVLHNTTVSSKATSTYLPTTTTSTSTSTSRSRQPQIQTPSSIFPSNTNKPALGQIFTQFPELHLFISKLPKGREDAELLYGQDEDSVSGQKGAVSYCYVVEVLKDETPNLGFNNEKEKEDGKGKRFGWREQRWTAVETTADEKGFVGAFQVKGNMRGVGLEREKIGGLRDVGNVAKIYGFGGRRL